MLALWEKRCICLQYLSKYDKLMKANEKTDKLRQLIGFGVPDWIRTNDTRRRRPVLYPAELRIRAQSAILFYCFCVVLASVSGMQFPISMKNFSR